MCVYLQHQQHVSSCLQVLTVNGGDSTYTPLFQSFHMSHLDLMGFIPHNLPVCLSKVGLFVALTFSHFRILFLSSIFSSFLFSVPHFKWRVTVSSCGFLSSRQHFRERLIHTSTHTFAWRHTHARTQTEKSFFSPFPTERLKIKLASKHNEGKQKASAIKMHLDITR